MSVALVKGNATCYPVPIAGELSVLIAGEQGTHRLLSRIFISHGCTCLFISDTAAEARMLIIKKHESWERILTNTHRVL